MTKLITVLGTSAVVAMIAACTQPTDDGAPADTESLEKAATITNNGWTANAVEPYTWPRGAYGDIAGGASFSGTGTRKMGICVLQLTTTPCNTVADCGSSPASLPAGGSRYCTLEDGTLQKVCAFRPGAQTSYCAGSPANGGVAVAAGSYRTPSRTATDRIPYVSMACFEGCSASDPSVSSAGYKQCKTDVNGYVGDKYADYCVDQECDGAWDWCSGPSGRFAILF